MTKTKTHFQELWKTYTVQSNSVQSGCKAIGTCFRVCKALTKFLIQKLMKFNVFWKQTHLHLYSSHHHLIPNIIGALGLKKALDCLWVYPDFRLTVPRPGIFLPEIFWAEIRASVLYDKAAASLRYRAAGDHCGSTTDICEISGQLPKALKFWLEKMSGWETRICTSGYRYLLDVLN